jgi:hypothetical protein
LYPISRRARALIVAICVASCMGTAVALAQPSISTDRGCYLVGQTVNLSGQGFTPDSAYVVSLDGVYLGTRTADSHGNFAIPLHPGGLPAGAAQHMDHVKVSDGTNTGTATFTVTRSTGARILTSGSGSAQSIQARFQVWGFSLTGTPRQVYVHYVDPSGSQQARTLLGRIGGQCGYFTFPRQRLFPFSVSRGSWTLQFDTHKSYSPHPSGAVHKISVMVA